MKQKKMIPIQNSIYINGDFEESVFTYTNIAFKEFLHLLPVPLNNVLLLKGNFCGNSCSHFFELLEGKEYIEKLAGEKICNWGDFCFVDYPTIDNPKKLTPQMVAELLYLAHTFTPLSSPFFEGLENNFAYLSHDDDFACKLYCREQNIIIQLLVNKIYSFVSKKLKTDVYPIQNNLNQWISSAITQGLLIDFDSMEQNKGEIKLPLCIIGKVSDMDEIYLHYSELKSNAKQTHILQYSENSWNLYS